jgi:SAM-dependent methyltransferase
MVAVVPRNFCTLFDARYLARGLVTVRSLRAVLPAAEIRVLCIDSETKRVLDRLAEPGVATIDLAELEQEDPALASVKTGRTRGEYCWTATPALCRFVLDREPGLDELTYLDADLLFFGNPEPIFEELGDDSVLIIPHRYAPQWADQERAHGIYNVEWVTFRRDERGLVVLDWWRERCIEWCYARVEDGKFGDQKYLDDWPQRFQGVHVLRHPGGGLAPWNVPRHRLRNDGGSISVDGEPLVFFHAHSLALHRLEPRVRALAALDLPLGPRIDEGVGWSTNYPIGADDRAWIWGPYLRRLLAVSDELRESKEPVGEPYVPLDYRKVLRPVASSARRRLQGLREAARSTLASFNGHSSADDWDRGAAPEMLELVRAQLEAAETVAPFRGFRYALDAVVADAQATPPLRLLDIGCGVGHYSELVDRWYTGQVEYAGVDLSDEMLEVAAATWPGRRFSRDDVLASRVDYDEYDVLLAGALVDVLREWRPALAAVLGSAAPYVILHRQRVSARRTMVHRAGGYAGGTTFRTILSEADLAAAFERHGRELLLRLPVEPGIDTFVLRKSHP